MDTCITRRPDTGDITDRAISDAFYVPQNDVELQRLQGTDSGSKLSTNAIMEGIRSDSAMIDLDEDFSVVEEVQSGQANVRVKVLRAHTDAVRCCNLTAHDTLILSASDDKSVILWNFRTGEKLQRYRGHEEPVSKVVGNEDGTKFVSSCWDKKVRMWDLETSDVLWHLKHISMVTCCNISHNGKMVVSGTDLDHNISLWDAETGELIARNTDLHTSTITSVAFSPNDDRIISTSMDMTAKVWDLKSYKCTLILRGHKNVISDASCSNNERKLATVSWDKTVKLWDLSTGMYRSTGCDVIPAGHEGNISSCSFSWDSSRLVTGGFDNNMVLWDVDNMCRKLRLMGHSDWVLDVCSTRDNNWLISCSKDQTLRIWNIEHSNRVAFAQTSKRSIGMKIYKCTSCGKPFLVNQMDSMRTNILCAFCRRQATQCTTIEVPIPHE